VATVNPDSSATVEVPANDRIGSRRDDFRADLAPGDVTGLVRSRASLHVEVLALRHQLLVLQRSRPRRLRLVKADRWLWVWLSRSWTDWRAALVIVKPETVIAWHRQGFRLLWTWKSPHRGGGPPVPADVRALIRTMSQSNPLWGAPRMHGKLLKLGVDVSRAAVAKYIVRRIRPPSQTWRTFLTNHVHQSPRPTSSSCRRQRVNSVSGFHRRELAPQAGFEPATLRLTA